MMGMGLGLGERLSAKLKLDELKKNSLRKAVLVLMLEWKDMDDHLDSTQKLFNECFNDIQSRQNRLLSIQQSITDSNTQLELTRASLEERANQLQFHQHQFDSLKQEHVRYFYSKEKELNSILKSAQDSVKEAELREQKLLAQQQLVEAFFQKIQSHQDQFQPIHKSIQEKLDDLRFKENNLENRLKQFDAIQDSIDTRAKELCIQEERIEERFHELEIQDKHLHSVAQLNDQRSLQLDSRENQLDSVKTFQKLFFKEYLSKKKELQSDQKLFEQRSKELHSKEKHLHDGLTQLEFDKKIVEQRFKELESKGQQLDACLRQPELDQNLYEEHSEELQSKEKQLHDRLRQLEFDQNLFEQRSKELESKEKQLNDRLRELNLRKGEYHNELPSCVKTEQLEDIPGNYFINRSTADLQILVTMDGKTLQIFLNGREKEHNLMSNEVFRALRFSSDPAKLVLDAMEGFYPPHLKNGDVEFEGSVVRSSCILLLEQLRRMSPQIQPPLRDAAFKLAGQWKQKMRAVTDKNPMEVLGFMHLLASYGLAQAFDSDELLGLFEVVAEHRQTPELCRLLGLVDCIPDLVDKLIGKRHHLVAVRFICAFGLLDKFPPAPLLKGHLNYLKRISINMTWENRPCETKNEAIENRVDALRDVVRCIVDNKLESEYCPKVIEKRIENLLMQKDRNKFIALRPHRKDKKQQKIEKKHTPSNTTAIPTKALPPKASSSVFGTATAMGIVLANMDGKSLQFLLNEHFEDHDFMRNEVSVALQVAFDPAKLVLDAVQGCDSLAVGDKNLESSVTLSSCLLLLELLMGLSPIIKHKWKKEAAKLAVDWKTKIRAETADPLEILCFLHLIGTYGLASAFDAGELLNLLERVAQHQKAAELCQVVGLSEMIPSSSILHPRAKIEESLGIKVYEKEVEKSVCSEAPTFILYASDPSKLVLDALRGCYNSKKSNSKHIMKSFIFLLEQLASLSVEIKPCVREEAMEFAVDWKEKLSGSHLNPSEVFAFLQFLATYKLTSSVNEDELLGLFDIVHHREQATDISGVLGLSHMIPNFIQNLIQKGEWLEAIRYIYANELVDKFPPVPLLKAHLSHSEKLAKKICEEGQYSRNSQRLAATKQICAIKAAMKCIANYGLESEYSLGKLEKRIEQLQRKKATPKILLPSLALKAQLKKQNKKKRPAPLTPNSQPQPKKHLRYVVPTKSPPFSPLHLMESPPQHSGQLSDQSGPYFDRQERAGPPTRYYSPNQHQAQFGELIGPYFDWQEKLGSPSGHYSPREQCGPYIGRRERVEPPSGHYSSDLQFVPTRHYSHPTWQYEGLMPFGFAQPPISDHLYQPWHNL